MGAVCGKAEPDDSGSKPNNKAEATSPKSAPAQQVASPEPVSANAKKTPPSSTPASPRKPEDFPDEEEIEIRVEELEQFYEVGKVIGEGGFSIVYTAIKKEDGKKYAIKKIKKADLELEEDSMKLLMREIRIMKELTHPNILKLYDVFEDEDFYSLVMELVEGQELFETIVKRGHFTEKDASNVIKQIVSAVGYLHDQPNGGIAHRDLKPENILMHTVNGKDEIKLADFGFSNQGEKFMTGLGSLGYVAPEVLEEKPYGKSCDMWSVGVILYILLAGFPPFTGDTAPQLCTNTIQGKYDFEDPVWDEVSEEAKDLIKHLLVVEPSGRLTAEEFLKNPWVKGEIKEVEKVDAGWL